METHSESSDPLIESASRISKRFPRSNTFRVIGPRRSLNHFLSFTSIGEQYECFRPICFEDCDGKQHFIEFWFKLPGSKEDYWVSNLKWTVGFWYAKNCHSKCTPLGHQTNRPSWNVNNFDGEHHWYMIWKWILKLAVAYIHTYVITYLILYK